MFLLQILDLVECVKKLKIIHVAGTKGKVFYFLPLILLIHIAGEE